MFRLICLIIAICCSSALWAQQQPIEVPLNSSTIFKNAQGEVLSFEDFLEQTSGRDYEMNPVFNEDNELKEVILVKSSITERRAAASPESFANTIELIDHIPPDFEGVDLQGKYYSTENLQGKVVVLKFWFKACKPCVDEIPELNQLVANYRGNPEVVFLAPSLDKKNTVQSFIQRMPFAYSIIPEARKIAHSYNVPGYPTHVVINRFGKVTTVYLGVNHRIKDKLTNAIEHALNQVTPDPVVAPSPMPPGPKPVAAEEEEIFISPASIIKDEAGNILPFEQFIERMNSGQEYELLPKAEDTGEKYILMKKIQR